MQSTEDEEEAHIDERLPTPALMDVMSLRGGADCLDVTPYFVPCSIFASVKECNDILKQQAALQEFLFNPNNFSGGGDDDDLCLQVDSQWSGCDAQFFQTDHETFAQISEKMQDFLSSLPSSTLCNGLGIGSVQDISAELNCRNKLCHFLSPEQSFPEGEDVLPSIVVSCDDENCSQEFPLPNCTNDTVDDVLNRTVNCEETHHTGAKGESNHSLQDDLDSPVQVEQQLTDTSEPTSIDSVHIVLPHIEIPSLETAAHQSEEADDSLLCIAVDNQQETLETSMQIPRSPRNRALSCPEFAPALVQIKGSSLGAIPEHPLEAHRKGKLLYRSDTFLAESDIEGELQDLLDSITPLDANVDPNVPRRPSDDLPWSTLLMYGLDDPHRMTFTQSLAFPMEPADTPLARKRRRDAHMEAEQRFNNYAKLITLVIFVIAVSSIVGFLYKFLK